MRIVGYLFGLLQLASIALALIIVWQSFQPTRGANMILMAMPLIATIAVLFAVCQVVLLRIWKSSFSPLERVVLQAEAVAVLILAAAGVAFS